MWIYTTIWAVFRIYYVLVVVVSLVIIKKDFLFPLKGTHNIYIW